MLYAKRGSEPARPISDKCHNEEITMYCPSCGIALSQPTKFCNRCGAALSPKDSELMTLLEKRMDSEMEGLFWIVVMGIGLVLGGMALMKSVQLSDWLITAFMVLSSTAFMTYFGLGVWQVRRLSRSLKEGTAIKQTGQLDTSELGPGKRLAPAEPVPSVTENTTRTLEPMLTGKQLK